MDAAGDVADNDPTLREIDTEISRFETEKETILRDGLAKEPEPEQRDYSHSYGGGLRARPVVVPVNNGWRVGTMRAQRDLTVNISRKDREGDT
jgi:hypothetical protein